MKSAKARQLRNNPTDAERHLWQHLRLRQIGRHRFRRQQPLGPYIVDFVCLEQRLVIEVDGGQHSEQVEYDNQRSVWLTAQGFRVLRFWNNEVLQEVEAVKKVIGSALCGEQPPSLILPRKGGGKK
jgi:very-short-patch-repair endonuclease